MKRTGASTTKLDPRLITASSLAFVLALALAFTLALSPGVAKPAHADRLTAQSVSYLPYVTAAMTKAPYWSGKQKNPDAVLANRATIDALNQAGIDADDTYLQPLKADYVREYFYDADQQATLKAGAKTELEKTFLNKVYDEDGNIVDQAYIDQILANYPQGGLTPSIQSGYAIVTTHTTMRAYPTDKALMYTKGDSDDDNLYLSALRVNEPLIVRSVSADGNFLLCISSCMQVEWVPTKDVAICKGKAEWLGAWDIAQGHELVVTGYKVRTEQSRVTPNTANRMLYMGTVLESVDWNDARKLVGTRSVYNNHVCYLPVRNADGTYSKEVALIAESDNVSEGYLPLTKANIAKVAFNSLGQMYGWGGMLEANDCSGYVRDVYKCFGLELARNTTWQMNMPVRKYDLTGLDDAHKAAAIAQMPLGTVLFWDGHEMIYLGQENGRLYVLSAVGAIGDIFGNEYTSTQVKGVVINTLDMVRASRATWLSSLTTATIPYISASAKGSGLHDISFYEGSTSWPKASYAYTGKAIKPAVSVSGLTAGTDYKVTYKNNTKAGATATVTITGIGSYSGTMSKAFKIVKASQTIKAKANVSKSFKASKKTKKLAKAKTVDLKKLANVSAKTAVKYKKANTAGGKNITMNAKTGKVTLKKGLKKGTYKVKVKLTASANASYNAAKAKTITLKVVIS